MVFTDWTFANINGTSSCALDSSVVHSGSSSVKFSIANYVSIPVARLTHNTFLEPQAQVKTWIRRQLGDSSSIPSGKIRHSVYGVLDTYEYATNDTFEKFMFTFWYDIDSNTKWGRIEKYVASAWVQQGTDTNFGSGSPASGTIALEINGVVIKGGQVIWFDDIEIFA